MSLGKGIKWGLGIIIFIFSANFIAIFMYLQFFGDDKVEFVPTNISNPTKFKQDLAVQEMRFLMTAIQDFKGDLKRFPTSEENLVALITQPPGLDKWNGPYFPRDQIPLDPWGNPYVYRIADEEHLKIISFGADGKEGGNEANSDLTVEP